MTPLILLYAAASTASGATWTGEICFRYGTDYDQTNYGEDKWVNNQPRAARGALVQVWDVTSNTPVWTGNVTESGTGVGCETFTPGPNHPGLEIGHAFRITMWADATLNGGNRIKVWNNDANVPPVEEIETVGVLTPPPYSQVFTQSFHPSMSVMSIVYTTYVHEVWNIAAAAGWGMFQSNGGLTNITYRIKHVGPTDGSGAQPNSRVNLSSGNAMQKQTVVHELGHCLARNAAQLSAGKWGWIDTVKEPGDKCISRPSQKGGMHRRHYNAIALNEAAGHHYGNLAWNNYGVDAVMPMIRQTDWNLQGPDSTGNDWAFDGDAVSGQMTDICNHCFELSTDPCTSSASTYDWSNFDNRSCYDWYFEAAEGGMTSLATMGLTPIHLSGPPIPVVSPYTSAADGDDYLAFCHGESSEWTGHPLHVGNRATQVDYTRFLWSMYYQGMSFSTFLDVVDAADPGPDDPVHWAMYSDVVSDSAAPAAQLKLGAKATPKSGGGDWEAIWAATALTHGVHR